MTDKQLFQDGVGFANNNTRPPGGIGETNVPVAVTTGVPYAAGPGLGSYGAGNVYGLRFDGTTGVEPIGIFCVGRPSLVDEGGGGVSDQAVIVCRNSAGHGVAWFITDQQGDIPTPVDLGPVGGDLSGRSIGYGHYVIFAPSPDGTLSTAHLNRDGIATPFAPYRQPIGTNQPPGLANLFY